MQVLTLVALYLKQSWKDKRGQDLIEYALMAGFVAVAAGAIFSEVASVMTGAASQGS
jgi:pilus assembly protein Flp/PilA